MTGFVRNPGLGYVVTLDPCCSATSTNPPSTQDNSAAIVDIFAGPGSRRAAEGEGSHSRRGSIVSRRRSREPEPQTPTEVEMQAEEVEMSPAIGSDGEPIYCVADPETSTAEPTPPQSPFLALLILGAAAGMILVAMTGRLK